MNLRHFNKNKDTQYTDHLHTIIYHMKIRYKSHTTTQEHGLFK